MYRIIKFEYLSKSEEEEEDGWCIEAQFKKLNSNNSSKYCLIGCRKFNQEESSPDLIRELRSEWIYEKDQPVYFIRRKDDNQEFFDKVQRFGDLFSEMELL